MRVGISFVLASLINALIVGTVAFAAVGGAFGRTAPLEVIVSGAVKLADTAAVAHQVVGVGSVSPVVSGVEPVSVGSNTLRLEVRGVAPEFVLIDPWQLEQGGFFTAQQDAASDPVAVINDGLARQLFQTDQAAVGQSLRIGQIPFTVVGVGTDKPGSQVILVPFHTGQIRLFGPSSLNQIVLQVVPNNQTTSVSQQIEQLLRQRHSLKAGQPDDFSVSNAPAVAETSTPAVEGRRVVQLAQQVACVAKNACPRGEQT